MSKTSRVDSAISSQENTMVSPLLSYTFDTSSNPKTPRKSNGGHQFVWDSAQFAFGDERQSLLYNISPPRQPMTPHNDTPRKIEMARVALEELEESVGPKTLCYTYDDLCEAAERDPKEAEWLKRNGQYIPYEEGYVYIPAPELPLVESAPAGPVEYIGISTTDTTFTSDTRASPIEPANASGDAVDLTASMGGVTDAISEQSCAASSDLSPSEEDRIETEDTRERDIPSTSVTVVAVDNDTSLNCDTIHPVDEAQLELPLARNADKDTIGFASTTTSAEPLTSADTDASEGTDAPPSAAADAMDVASEQPLTATSDLTSTDDEFQVEVSVVSSRCTRSRTRAAQLAKAAAEGASTSASPAAASTSAQEESTDNASKNKASTPRSTAPRKGKGRPDNAPKKCEAEDCKTCHDMYDPEPSHQPGCPGFCSQHGRTLVFSTQAEVEDHINNFHCCKNKETVRGLIESRTIADENGATKTECKMWCPWDACQKGFEPGSNITTLRRHIQSDHILAKIPCPECGQWFANDNSLNNHLKGSHQVDTKSKRAEALAASHKRKSEEREDDVVLRDASRGRVTRKKPAPRPAKRARRN